MKLTDFLSDVGRPVAYYPELRKITGSVTATILLCQFIYWRGKESDPNGWLYKTAEDIKDETGLSYGEQKTARRDLVTAGLIDEHYARLDHQMRFKLNLEAINLQWENEVSNNGESGKPTFGNDEKPLSLNESESTTENTASNFSPTTKQDLAKTSFEAAIFADEPIEQEQFDRQQLRDIAPKMFEKALGFSKPLPWWSTKEWETFADWVVAEYAKSKTSFGEYNNWRNEKFVKGGIANTRLRGFPNEFYDSWDMFIMATRPEQKSKSHGL